MLTGLHGDRGLGLGAIGGGPVFISPGSCKWLKKTGSEPIAVAEVLHALQQAGVSDFRSAVELRKDANALWRDLDHTGITARQDRDNARSTP